MQKKLRRLECFELYTILTVVLEINPNVIDESPSKLVENSIFMSNNQGKKFFFQLYTILNVCLKNSPKNVLLTI